MEAQTVSCCSSLRYHVFRRWHSSLAFSHSPTPQCQNSQDCYQSITAADATHVAYAIQCNSVQHIQLMQMTLKLSKTQATYQSLPMCPRNLHFQRCAGVEAGGRRGGGRQNHHHGHQKKDGHCQVKLHDSNIWLSSKSIIAILINIVVIRQLGHSC